MNKILRKIALRSIIGVKGRMTRFYWSWYERENERELLHQLTKILEDDDETQNN